MEIPNSIISEPDYLGEKFTKPMAWIDLLLQSNDGVVRASYHSLALRWKWSVNKVIRFLDHLESVRSVERSFGTFKGNKTKQIISILSNSYKHSQENDGTFRGTFQKHPPLSPSVSPSLSPTPLYPSSSTPPISPLENSAQNRCASAYVREQDSPHPPTPFPNPFILSSVERDWCQRDPEKIVQCKRRHLAENLKAVAPEFGMDGVAQEKFLDWWCSPAVRNPSEIRAEADGHFNLRLRVENWMKKDKQADKPASRIAQYASTMKKFNDIMDSIYGPDNYTGTTSGLGYSPDEQ